MSVTQVGARIGSEKFSSQLSERARLRVVLGALAGIQANEESNQLHRGEVRAHEVRVRHLEHHGTNERIERRCLVASCGGRCRAEPEARDGGARLQRLDTCTGSEVMNLVDDEEAKPLADRVHMTKRALESEDGNALDAPLSVPDHPDAFAEATLELCDPGRSECSGRTQNRARQAGFEEGRDRNPRLAGARG
jgi:hypothetical protein